MPRTKKGARKSAAASKKKSEAIVVSESEHESEAEPEQSVSPNHTAAEDDVADLSTDEAGNGDVDVEPEEDPSEDDDDDDYSANNKSKAKKSIKSNKRSKSATKKGKAKASPKRKAPPPPPKKSPRAPPAKKSKKDEAAEEEEDSDQEYEVERIIDCKIHRNGVREFEVKWKGYPASESTWEPESNLTSSQELIDAFMAKLEKVKDLPDHELRVNRKQTQRYFDTKRDQSVRSSRRNANKASNLPRARRLNRSLSRNSTTRRPKTIASTQATISSAESKSSTTRRRRNFGSVETQNNKNQPSESDTTTISTPKQFQSQSSPATAPTGNDRSIKRAVLLTAGTAISIGAAVFLSSNPNPLETISSFSSDLLNRLK